MPQADEVLVKRSDSPATPMTNDRQCSSAAMETDVPSKSQGSKPETKPDQSSLLNGRQPTATFGSTPSCSSSQQATTGGGCAPMANFSWMAMQPFGGGFVAQQAGFPMDASVHMNRLSFESLLASKAENERRSADGISPVWRPGSGGHTHNPMFYPQFPIHPMYYNLAAADAARVLAMATGSRPASPKGKKRPLSLSPGSDRSMVIDAIRNSPTSLLYNDFNSRSSSAASVGSFGHISAGPGNHSFSHFRTSPIMGAFPGAAAPFPLAMPVPNMNSNLGYPFPNPAFYASNFPPFYYNFENAIPPQKSSEAASAASAAPSSQTQLKDEEMPMNTSDSELPAEDQSRPSYSSSDIDVEDEQPSQMKPEPADGFAETICHWAGCCQQYDTLDALVAHVMTVHVETSAKKFICRWEMCSRQEKPFKAKYMLAVHMRQHTGFKPHKCTKEGCDKAYSRLENLKTHIRSHTGEKPYKCEFTGCRKAFTNASDRAKHQSRTHSNEKRFICYVPGCSSKYTDPSSLRKHVHQKHGKEAFINRTYKGIDNSNDQKESERKFDGPDEAAPQSGNTMTDWNSDNPSSNQSGSVESPGTFSSTTDDHYSSISPRQNDSGVEMNAFSDTVSTIADIEPLSGIFENEAVVAVLADGDGDDVFASRFPVPEARRRFAGKTSLSVITGDTTAGRMNRIAEYVTDSYTRYSKTSPSSVARNCAVPPQTSVHTAATIESSKRGKTASLLRSPSRPQTVSNGSHFSYHTRTSGASSDYGSMHSASEATYPTSAPSSPSASRPGSAFSFASQSIQMQHGYYDYHHPYQEPTTTATTTTTSPQQQSQSNNSSNCRLMSLSPSTATSSVVTQQLPPHHHHHHQPTSIVLASPSSLLTSPSRTATTATTALVDYNHHHRRLHHHQEQQQQQQTQLQLQLQPQPQQQCECAQRRYAGWPEPLHQSQMIDCHRSSSTDARCQHWRCGGDQWATTATETDALVDAENLRRMSEYARRMRIRSPPVSGLSPLSTAVAVCPNASSPVSATVAATPAAAAAVPSRRDCCCRCCSMESRRRCGCRAYCRDQIDCVCSERFATDDGTCYGQYDRVRGCQQPTVAATAVAVDQDPLGGRRSSGSNSGGGGQHVHHHHHHHYQQQQPQSQPPPPHQQHPHPHHQQPLLLRQQYQPHPQYPPPPPHPPAQQQRSALLRAKIELDSSYPSERQHLSEITVQPENILDLSAVKVETDSAETWIEMNNAINNNNDADHYDGGSNCLHRNENLTMTDMASNMSSFLLEDRQFKNTRF